MNNPGARLPYSKMEQYGILVEGPPEGKTLKHPSSYGAQTLKAILAKKDSIKLKGMLLCAHHLLTQRHVNEPFLSSFKIVNHACMHTLVW